MREPEGPRRAPGAVCPGVELIGRSIGKQRRRGWLYARRDAAIRSSLTPPRWLFGTASGPTVLGWRERLVCSAAAAGRSIWWWAGAKRRPQFLCVGARRRIVDHIGRLLPGADPPRHGWGSGTDPPYPAAFLNRRIEIATGPGLPPGRVDGSDRKSVFARSRFRRNSSRRARMVTKSSAARVSDTSSPQSA